MANHDVFFFYPPTWDYPPNGAIKLGNIMTSINKPHRPLSCSAPPNDSEVFKTTKKTVQYTKEKLKSGKFSILTKFLSVLGFGVDVGAEVGGSGETNFIFTTLESSEFIPTSAYLQACIQDKAVERFLQTSCYRKPIYVITGIKVATGAEGLSQSSSVLGGNLALEVDGTLLSGGMVPVGGGPGVEGKLTKQAVTSWKGSSDFVFAFRVSRVFVRKRTKQLLEDEYQKGAMLEDGTEVVKGPELEISAVQEPTAEEEGFDAAVLMDGDEMVAVALPKEN